MSPLPRRPYYRPVPYRGRGPASTISLLALLGLLPAVAAAFLLSSTAVAFAAADAAAAALAPFGADDLAALAPYECYSRLPGQAGPQVVSARTRALVRAVRSKLDVLALAAQLRVPGVPLQVARGGGGGYGWQ